MVRLIFIAACFISFLNATLLEDKIESFIGEKVFNTQKNLINILFQDKSRFLNKDSSVNDLEVLKGLKESGLLKLFYGTPKDLELSFFNKEDSLIFMRVINESLSLMGYNYFLTKKVLKNEDGFLWTIIISTEHMVDPIIFSKRLENRGCYFEEIKRTSELKWYYKINTDAIKIDALEIEPNTTVKLKKPIKPYWINVEDMQSISFRSRIADKWHPSIVFFDKKLDVVRDYRDDNVVDSLKLKIPKSAKYIKIEDIYTLDNIKRGISIYLKRRN